jgi:2-dehydro-3-deoxy-D-arabinonate dehydratase
MLMQLVRFFVPGYGARLGQLKDGSVYDLTSIGRPEFSSISSLLKASLSTPLPELLKEVDLSGSPGYAFDHLDVEPTEGAPYLLPPVDRQEVWAAGVTYEWSREARVREAQAKDVYVKVYEAERPELFFKCPGSKAVGPNDWIGLRGDSRWNVPEPELTLVLNPALDIVGFTIGNDVSSRDIEGENPLYLPQAKIYRHSCALGPIITLSGRGFDANAAEIELVILRSGDRVFAAQTQTSRINRQLTELARFLGRYNDFLHGALLMTGTGIVPPDDFTLQDGDAVEIRIEGIGVLRNTVRQM